MRATPRSGGCARDWQLAEERGWQLISMKNDWKYRFSRKVRDLRPGLFQACRAIPDPIPDLVRPAEVAPLNGAFNVLFICSWAEDEPYLEVLRAAAALDSDIFIYITGNSRGKEQQLGTTLPANVVLTGYLHEQEFNALLFRCDVAMVLTTRDNCLLCGAYEGVAAGKPLLLSDTRALRNYFSKGAVYIENTADLIARGIEDSRSRHASIRQEVAELKNMRNSEYKLLLENLEQQLARL